ncbi:hypothetical protein RSOLAG22IIIB_05657 [Rhizoctonia solani]|uniref:Uncharacterized protein n=1 Tax=Rhizoctonia solani TaxID=456999 RepID=A0A0K6G883_9AGAM|nr:hypothetical protein RSOLAG22IIIB_05657 [Rhizoctonia solani]
MSQFYQISGRPILGQNKSQAVRDALSNAPNRKQPAYKGKGGRAEMTTLEFVSPNGAPCEERIEETSAEQSAQPKDINVYREG